ncbi:MAG: hypothetical protein ACREQ7_10560 [Candidatus Binatia bacterium]
MKSSVLAIICLLLITALYLASGPWKNLIVSGSEQDQGVREASPARESLPSSRIPASFGACHYYASPFGGGNGSSPLRPFKVAQFWSVAGPGKILCLLDGMYTGDDSMIDPPHDLSGAPGRPIAVRSLTEGKVTINGQGARIPVLLNRNSYFVLEGFNAHSSKSGVVRLNRADHNVVRRVAAWDAADGNSAIVSVSNSEYVLFEDLAAWGIGRKVFQASQGGNHVTCRRCWGRWEGSHFMGPKLTYSLAYNNYDMTIENSIGTWSGEKMQESYFLRCNDWRAYARCGRYMTDYAVDQPEAVFGVDAMTKGSKAARSRILGSIAYVTAKDRFEGHSLFWVTNLDAIEYRNNAAFVDPVHEGKRPFALYGMKGGGAEALVARNLTAIGARPSLVHSSWRTSRVLERRSTDKAGNIFAGTQGARICKRYKDAILTDEPLWPWPMNDRIIAAMIESGRAPIDVTKTIEAIFGSIPSQCRS